MTSSSRLASLAIGLLFAGVGATAANAIEPIAANVARLYVGTEAIIEGRVRETSSDGNVVSLFLGDNKNEIEVALILGLLSNFPDDPEAYYQGRRVRVVGRLEEFRGDVQMLVRDPSNIQLVSAISPAGLKPVPGAPVNPAEVELLRHRLRALEKKLEQLETGSAAAESAAQEEGDQ